VSYELRRRLVGVVVLVSLGLVIIPLLFDFSRDQPLDRRTQIPPAPTAAPVELEVALRPQLLESSAPPSPLFTMQEVSASSRRFAVQFGSYPDLAVAEQKRQQLLEAGYKVYIRSVEVEGKETHRVLIGPLLQRDEAEALQRQIDNQYQISSLLKAQQ